MRRATTGIRNRQPVRDLVVSLTRVRIGFGTEENEDDSKGSLIKWKQETEMLIKKLKEDQDTMRRELDSLKRGYDNEPRHSLDGHSSKLRTSF